MKKRGKSREEHEALMSGQTGNAKYFYFSNSQQTSSFRHKYVL